MKQGILQNLQRNNYGRLNLIISSTIFVFLLLFARFDFDGGHEGYILTTALAQRAGYTMFLDFYSIYGPVLPFVHSLAILDPEYALIFIRVFDDLTIALICFLFLNLIRFKSIPIKYEYLVFTVIAWVSLSYFFFGQTQLAWSSTLAVLFQIALLNFMCRIYSGISTGSRNFLPEFGTSVLLVALPLTRLNSGLLTNFITLVFMLIMAFRNTKFKWIMIRISIMSALLTLFIIVYFYLNNTLRLMYEQCFLLPVKLMTSNYVAGQENWNALPVILNYFLRSLPLIALFLLVLIFLDRTQLLSKFLDKGNKLTYRLMISILAVTFGLLLVYLLQSTERLAWGYSRFIVFVTIFGIIAALYLIISEVFFEKFNSVHIHFPIVLAALYGLCGIIQIYPTHDARHIWYGLPFLILTLPLFMGRLNWRSSREDVWSFTLSLLILPMLCLMISGIVHTSSAERVAIDFNAPYKGMLVKPSEYIRLKSEFLFLEKHLKPNQKAFFECGHGQTYWQATFDGEYYSQSKWFVDFSDFPGVPSPDWNLVKDDVMIICGDPSVQASMAYKFNVSIFDSNEYLAIAVYRN